MIPITQQQYVAAKERLKMRPFSSFSDPDGTSPLGNRRPQMVTHWAVDGREMLRYEMFKDSRHDLIWQERFYALVDPSELGEQPTGTDGPFRDRLTTGREGME